MSIAVTTARDNLQQSKMNRPSKKRESRIALENLPPNEFFN